MPKHEQALAPAYSEREIIDRVPGRLSGRVGVLLGIMVALGLVGFVAGAASAPQRTWQVYLVNFLFFSGLAAAGVIFGAAMQIAKGHWGKGFRRLAEREPVTQAVTACHPAETTR